MAYLLARVTGMAFVLRSWSLRSLVATRMGSEALVAASVELWVSTVTGPRLAGQGLRGTCFTLLSVAKVFVFRVTRIVSLEMSVSLITLPLITKINSTGLTTLNFSVPKVTASSLYMLNFTRASLLILGGVVIIAGVNLAVVVESCWLYPVVPPLSAALRVVYLRVAASRLG